MKARAIALLLATVTLLAPCVSALEVPFLSGRVNDTTGVLSAEVKQRIEDELSKLEQDKGVQVAVLMIPTLDGESLEEYSLRVAETWKLGRGKFDDGALILIARDDRQMRIEVGYGLEGVLTDAKSRRVLDDVMRPRFREGDFDGGVEQAVKAIDGLLRGDEAALPPPEAESQGISEIGGRVMMFLIFSVVVGIFSLVALATEGGGAWFLYLFLIPFWFAFPLAIFGSPIGAFFGGGWMLGFPPLHRLFRKKLRSGKLFKSTKWATGGAPGGGWVWTTGGGGSRRGGSWGGGGGGFSGGGGSFGGGGASGSW